MYQKIIRKTRWQAGGFMRTTRLFSWINLSLANLRYPTTMPSPALKVQAFWAKMQIVQPAKKFKLDSWGIRKMVTLGFKRWNDADAPRVPRHCLNSLGFPSNIHNQTLWHGNHPYFLGEIPWNHLYRVLLSCWIKWLGGGVVPKLCFCKK